MDSNFVENETSCVLELFGRLENGESFTARKSFEPYFFVKEKDLKKINKLLSKYKVEKVHLKNFSEEPVAQIYAQNVASLTKLKEHLDSIEVETYEADIKPYARFCMDNDILGSIDLQGGHEKGERVSRVYEDPIIKPSEFKPKLKILSLDFETDESGEELYCAGLYGENYEKNLIVSDKKVKNAESYKTEEECFKALVEEIKKVDPDVITGWNVIDFDFNYFKQRCKKLGIRSDFGRGEGELRVRVSANFMSSSSANISGRQIIDGLNMIKDPFLKEAPMIKKYDFNSMTLEDVSQAILGKGKLLKGKGRHAEIEKLYKTDKESLVDYNMMDCKLVYEILEKTDLIGLAVERSQLTGLTIDRIGGSIAAFDSLYIRHARKKGFVSPTNTFRRKEERIKGGFVKDSKPGIYHDVLVLDFKSLYPSIITTFNIDPLSFTDKKKEKVVEAPNGALFINQEGILPEIIKKLHNEREKAKKEKKELASYALKITMNSFFGVLASPNCRYFSLDMANAITSFGREIIQKTAKQIEAEEHKVIYSDTDSVFVTANTKGKKADNLGIEIQDKINNFYKKYVENEYSRTSYLELQFEKHYLAFMIPALRKTETGAKKRYAGLKKVGNKEELEIVGLEAIRGDWTEAAQDFQKELLVKVFKKEKVDKFIVDYVKKIRQGNMDELLIYRKSIRKGLHQYTKTTPPHVKAARKLDHLEGSLIQYYITLDGPEPIQKLKHKLDYDHYIDKQIRPIADQILPFIKLTFDDIAKNSKQEKLF